MKRQDLTPAAAVERSQGVADLPRTWQKDQEISFCRVCRKDRAPHPRWQGAIVGLLFVGDLYRVATTLAFDDARAPESCCQLRSIEGCAHEDEAKLGVVFLAFEEKREQAINALASLMHFIDDHRGDTVERSPSEQASQQ